MSDTPRTDALGTNGYLETAMDLCRTLERELAQAVNSFSDGAKWIPAEERLPEGEGQVLAVNSLGYMACVTSLFRTPGGFDGEDATAEETDYPIGDVTHWMPLPEAPK